MTIESTVFRVEAWRHVKAAMLRRMWAWALLLLPSIGALVAWAVTADLAWLVAALILIMLVYPLAMLMAWTIYAFRRDAIQSVTPHTVTIDDDGLRLQFLPADEGCPVLPSAQYPLDAITEVNFSGRWIEVHAAVASAGRTSTHIIVILADALADVQTAVNKLSSRIPVPDYDD